MALWNLLRVVFDAAAVLIVVAVLGVLAVGPGVGAGAMVLILGSTGVAGVSAAGVLLTARPARSVRLPAAAGRSPTVSGRNEKPGCGVAPPGQSARRQRRPSPHERSPIRPARPVPQRPVTIGRNVPRRETASSRRSRNKRVSV